MMEHYLLRKGTGGVIKIAFPMPFASSMSHAIMPAQDKLLSNLHNQLFSIFSDLSIILTQQPPWPS